MSICENLTVNRAYNLKKDLKIKIGKTYLNGKLSLSPNAGNIVLIVQRNNNETCNQYIANSLSAAGISTLIINLLTDDEQQIDAYLYNYRFKGELLADRLIQATHWIQKHSVLKGLKINYFSTGIDIVPTLLAATLLHNQINAVITNGGRLDLVENILQDVKCPVLLLVASSDKVVSVLNKLAYRNMKCEKSIRFINVQSANSKDLSKFREWAQIVSFWLNWHHIDAKIKLRSRLYDIQSAGKFAKETFLIS